MQPPRLKQAPQTPRDKIFTPLKRQTILQYAITEHPRHHVHPRPAQMRNRNFQRVAIEEQPWRIGEAFLQQRPLTDIPGVEFDHQPLLDAATALPVRREQSANGRTPFVLG
ncbi:hypothetical protein D3C72_1380290 [compost metagenome]